MIYRNESDWRDAQEKRVLLFGMHTGAAIATALALQQPAQHGGVGITQPRCNRVQWLGAGFQQQHRLLHPQPLDVADG